MTGRMTKFPSPLNVFCQLYANVIMTSNDVFPRELWSTRDGLPFIIIIAVVYFVDIVIVEGIVLSVPSWSLSTPSSSPSTPTSTPTPTLIPASTPTLTPALTLPLTLTTTSEIHHLIIIFPRRSTNSINILNIKCSVYVYSVLLRSAARSCKEQMRGWEINAAQVLVDSE